MKKAAFHGNDHAKSFKVALGIAFTLLALVVVYVAFSKGGLDIRSRAALVSDVSLTGISPKCPSGYVLLSTSTYMKGSTSMRRILCRKIGLPKPTYKISAAPTRRPTPTPTYKISAAPTRRPTLRPTYKISATPIQKLTPTPTKTKVL